MLFAAENTLPVSVRLPFDDNVAEVAPVLTLSDVDANKFLHARPRDIEPASTALFEPGRTPPVVKMLPEAETVFDAAPEPTCKEFDANKFLKATPSEPMSDVLTDADNMLPDKVIAPAEIVVEAPPLELTFKDVEEKIFLQPKLTLPKSSVLAVSEIIEVLTATDAKLDKAVLAPVPPPTQVPSTPRKQPVES